MKRNIVFRFYNFLTDFSIGGNFHVSSGIPSLFIKCGPFLPKLGLIMLRGAKFAEFPKNNPTIEFRILKLV